MAGKGWRRTRALCIRCGHWERTWDITRAAGPVTHPHHHFTGYPHLCWYCRRDFILRARRSPAEELPPVQVHPRWLPTRDTWVADALTKGAP